MYVKYGCIYVCIVYVKYIDFPLAAGHMLVTIISDKCHCVYVCVTTKLLYQFSNYRSTGMYVYAYVRLCKNQVNTDNHAQADKRDHTLQLATRNKVTNEEHG
jgi:hypothetical protein